MPTTLTGTLAILPELSVTWTMNWPVGALLGIVRVAPHVPSEATLGLLLTKLVGVIVCRPVGSRSWRVMELPAVKPKALKVIVPPAGTLGGDAISEATPLMAMLTWTSRIFCWVLLAALMEADLKPGGAKDEALRLKSTFTCCPADRLMVLVVCPSNSAVRSGGAKKLRAMFPAKLLTEVTVRALDLLLFGGMEKALFGSVMMKSGPRPPWKPPPATAKLMV